MMLSPVRWRAALTLPLTLILFGLSAQAQVVLSAGHATGAPGDIVELPISATGPDAADTAIARLRIAYDSANAPYEPIYSSGGAVECFVANDLAGHVQPAPVMFQPQNNRIVVGFGDFSAPIEPFGREGLIMTCRVGIRSDARNGTFPLFCLGATTASDAIGRTIPSTCTPGSLTIMGAAGDDRGDVRYGGRPPVAPGVEIPAPQAQADAPAAPRGGETTSGRGSGIGTVATPLARRADEEATPGEGAEADGVEAKRPGVEAQRAGGTTGSAAVAGATPGTTTTVSPAGTPSPKLTATAASTATAKKTATTKKSEVEPTPKEDSGSCQITGKGSGYETVLFGLMAIVLMRRRRSH